MATAVIVLNIPRKAQCGVTALLLLAYIAFPVAEPVYNPNDLARPELGTFGVMSYFGMSAIAIVL